MSEKFLKKSSGGNTKDVAIVFAHAMSYCKKNDLKSMQIVVPQKKTFNHVLVELFQLYGIVPYDASTLANKLTKNREGNVVINGVTINCSAGDTLRTANNPDVLFFLWVTQENVTDINLYPKPKALFYVSFDENEGNVWEKKYNPTLL